MNELPVPKSHFDCFKFKIIRFSFDGCANCVHLTVKPEELKSEMADWRTKTLMVCGFKKERKQTHEQA